MTELDLFGVKAAALPDAPIRPPAPTPGGPKPCCADRHQVVLVSVRRAHPLLGEESEVRAHPAPRHLTAEELERIKQDLGAASIEQDCVRWGAAPARPQDAEAPPAEEEAPF